MRRNLLTFLFVGAQLIIAALVQSQIPRITYVPRISGSLFGPVDIVNAGDGTNRFFIAQLDGTIKVYDQAYTFLANFLTVTGISTGGEMGLLSLVFHPDYETNRYFFVYYTTMVPGPNPADPFDDTTKLNLARYQTYSGDPNLADPASRVIVLSITKPVGYTIHNGAKLNFGSDGYLYFATGDGGGGGDPYNFPQSGNSLLGKMLRINVTTNGVEPYYTIPPDNPYVSDPNVLDEIWAFGLRNPFRWSFDRLTNDMWIGDVGDTQREEINFRAAGTTAGVNYGWICYEGSLPYITAGCGPSSNYLFPIYDYINPLTGPSAITGGIVYRGSAYPGMVGYYFATDFYMDSLYLIKPNGSGGWTITVQTGGTQRGISAFGESENGELYAVSPFTETVFQLTSTSFVPVTFTNFSGSLKNSTIELNWQTATEENVDRYEIEYGSDGINFVKVGEVAATKAGSYRFTHNISGSKKHYYRLRTVDNDGTWEYSKIILVSTDKNSEKDFVRPSVITNNILQLDLINSYTSVQVINMKGSVVYKHSLTGRTGRVSLALPGLPAGNYLVRITGEESILTQKIVIR